MTDKEKLDQEARYQQMKINTRLTALQAAQTLMGTHGYAGVPGAKADTGAPVWIFQPQSVDHITLLAIAKDVEQYILDGIDPPKDTPKMTIITAKTMPGK